MQYKISLNQEDVHVLKGIFKCLTCAVLLLVWSWLLFLKSLPEVLSR